jgi:hypothetical protein
MEKILFVADTMELNNRSLDFAAFLCDLSHAKLTGILPDKNVIAESRYADMLLIDVRTDIVKDVLYDAECPVVIMPAGFDGIEQVVFTWDGEAASVYAIKQFTYLFPQLKDQQVIVISVNEPAPEERYKLKEWLHIHYKNVNFVSTQGNVRLELTELLLQRSRAFIVMGAYGRSAFSNFFSPSHATSVLKMVSQPVFIAH